MKKIKKPPITGIDLESKKILKQLNKTTRSLANLKGFSSTIPNKNMLIKFMSLREAKASSEIEQIVTTNDKLYREISNDKKTDPNTKEVLNYRGAMLRGFELIHNKPFMNTNDWIQIQEIIEGNREGIRRTPGTKIKNVATSEIVWTPPQNYQEIMSYLVDFVNDDTISDLDPLIKLALIHYQFEIVHPFYDGNGRTGRIINVLYLVLKDLLDSPIIYLSGYILEHRSTYYKLLNSFSYENWIIFILQAIEVTSNETNNVIHM